MRVPAFVNRVLGRVGLELRGSNLGGLTTYTGTNTTGVVVNERNALTLAAAFACINAIASDWAFLPLEVRKARKSGGSDAATDHAASDLLRVSPDGDEEETTAMRWRMAWMGHTLGWGNGYSEIVRDLQGRPTALHLIDSGTARPRRDEEKRLYYDLGNGKTLPARNVLHLAGLGFNGVSGYSPVQLFRQAWALGLATERFGGSYFGNGIMPKGALKLKKTLSKEARDRLRNDFLAIYGGVENALGMAVLEEGMEYQAFTISPEDAQFLATRAFQVLEICRIYRVPPHKVMDYAQAHLANLEESNIDYTTTTLAPWCKQAEGVYNLRLLTKQERGQGYYVKHNLTALLRGNMQSRAEFYTKMRDLGVYTPNIIADLEDMNPIGPDGDKRLVNAAMTTLAAAGFATPHRAKEGKDNGRATHHRNGLPS